MSGLTHARRRKRARIIEDDDDAEWTYDVGSDDEDAFVHLSPPPEPVDDWLVHDTDESDDGSGADNASGLLDFERAIDHYMASSEEDVSDTEGGDVTSGASSVGSDDDDDSDWGASTT